MADNIELDAGTGGAVIKTDDDGTAHWQYIKVAFGPDNTQTIVTSSAGLPVELLASSAAIGKLSANSGVDIGDVDVTTCGTITPGVAATSLGKAEDAAHSTGDVGVMALSVRKNTAASTSGTDGDYQPLITDTNGRLHVLDANTATIASDTTSIDGKITACNTGAVVISSGTITAITNDVSIDDGGNSITVDNNGTFATQATLQAGTAEIGKLAAGTATIGKLAANDGVDIGDVDVATQPARDRLTDNVGVALQTDVLLNDTTALTPKFAIIAASSSGDNTLVAAVVGKKIRVLQYIFVCAATVTVRFEDGAGGSALSGQMECAANSGAGAAFNPLGHFETTANTLLNLELSGATNTAGHLVYVEI